MDDGAELRYDIRRQDIMSDMQKHVRQPSEERHGGRRGTAMRPRGKHVLVPPVLTRDGRYSFAEKSLRDVWQGHKTTRTRL